MGEVPEAKGAAAEVFQPAIQGLTRAVRRAGPVEVRQHVGRPLLQRPAQHDDFGQRAGDTAADGLDEILHQLATLRAVRFAVGGDHLLVDGPGGFDLDVLIAGEQGFQASLLARSEKVQTGVQGPTGAVERIGSATAVAVQCLLDAAPALVEGITGQADDMEGIMQMSA